MKMRFGTILKKLREDNNLSQEELGEIVGVSDKTISSWEINRTEPKMEIIKLLASYFEVTIDYLINGDNNPHENEISLGHKIKTLRKEKGLTQEELGKLIGVQKSAVAKYENNRVENIKRSTIFKLAEILEVDPSYFFEEETSNLILGLDLGTTYTGTNGFKKLLSPDSIMKLSTFNDEEIDQVEKYISFIDSIREKNI